MGGWGRTVAIVYWGIMVVCLLFLFSCCAWLSNMRRTTGPNYLCGVCFFLCVRWFDFYYCGNQYDTQRFTLATSSIFTAISRRAHRRWDEASIIFVIGAGWRYGIDGRVRRWSQILWWGGERTSRIPPTGHHACMHAILYHRGENRNADDPRDDDRQHFDSAYAALFLRQRTREGTKHFLLNSFTLTPPPPPPLNVPKRNIAR